MLAFACAFTMFAGAAFTDEADIVNAEAVDLLTELNIINGYSDGSFNPEGDVTRAEFAKMIYVIRNGGNDDASAHANNPTSFTDLTDSWYQGYIKYLQNTGIVAGKTATQFDPDGNVTTGEALKMALVLGGYRADKAGLTGTKWLTNTVTLATTNRLLNDVNSSITGACTRQDAAQILANALDMTAVRYSEIVEDFVNDSEDGLALGGSSISVGRKWMDLWTNVGTLISIDGSDLDIQMSSSDRTDSDSDDEHFVKVDTDYSSLLGQKVKVLFKDGKNNSVLGVYPIDDNSVVTVNQNEISVDAGKIVIDDESYSVETDGVTVIRDGEELNENWKAGAFKDQQSADVITLIDTDDNNKIDTAYIKTVDVAKVTYVASSQIIAGSKTYKFSEDTIDEDVEKDDWVIITKNLYNDNNDIVVASKATGTVEATKDKTGWKQYQIGDEWFNETDSSNKDINTNVKPGVEAEYVAVNGILFYADKTSAGSDKLTDVLFVSYVGQDGLSNDQARVMFPNGDKATINLKNTYFTQQNGDKGTAIVPGQFYEYSKSGSTYELIALASTADFYGDFTYEGKEDLDTAGDKVDTDRISDSADVIVWTTDSHGTPANTTKADIKHITGKQLKALVSDGTLDVDGSSNNLYQATLGYFTSDVDGLNRASVIAVEFNGNGSLGTTFDNISSNANYGFITKDAVKLSNGNIKFTVWTGAENVEVVAEKSRENDFTKGTIVGYTAINDEDGNKVMTDAVAITSGVTAGSITSVNSKGTTIESSTINLPYEDLDDYSTVLYVDSKAGTGLEDGVATKANSQKVNGTTYYATNLLVYGGEVIVIDVNEIAGKRYGAYTLPSISGLSDVQWLNTRTNDTDEGAAYEGAIMQLSFYADKDGTLTLTNVADIETNDNDGTVTLSVKGGEYNLFDSLIVTGAGNVTATFTANGSTPAPDPSAATVEIKSAAPSLTFGGTTAFDVNVVYENAIGETPKMEVYTKADATTRSTNLVDSTNVTETTPFGFITSNNETAAQGKLTQGATLPAGDYVLVVKVGSTEDTQEFSVATQKIAAVTIANFTEATNAGSLNAYNPGTLSATLTPVAVNTATPVVDKAACVIANVDGDTIATGDTIVVKITVELTDANNNEFASTIQANNVTLTGATNTAVSSVAIVNGDLVITATTTVA
ncbi:S-layer protein [uncultured Butyricicoccus sp.]|uniref:S-layer homology domain-containing protein n=1 Tax=Agathobaculum ammoniilyticum TaxID=2981778 RepID=UPI00082154CF|nr:S-layer homology domain-containing protein [Agathobaculum ammoniilyticum]SCJ61140.1 S-layer protein [uncultured Butyricicoccus sp.]